MAKLKLRPFVCLFSLGKQTNKRPQSRKETQTRVPEPFVRSFCLGKRTNEHLLKWALILKSY
jgi:hypothetical protein